MKNPRPYSVHLHHDELPMTFTKSGSTVEPEGTLVWIGDRSSPDFREAYSFCEQHASQVAPRASIAEALSRPALGCTRVVIARATRHSTCQLEDLFLACPDSSFLELRGPLCSGEPFQRDGSIAQHDVSQWRFVLPASFGFREPSDDSIRSVAVVADSIDAAGSLLDLAESEGMTAVWVRRADTTIARGFDAVWWDDSVATPCNSKTWQFRVASFPTARRNVWIANSPQKDQRAKAQEGGIDVVLAKPFLVDSLTDDLNSQSCVARRAA